MSQKPPHGYDEIVKFYEWDPEVYLTPEGQVDIAWETKKIVRLVLPQPLRFMGKEIPRVAVHKNCLEVFDEFFNKVNEAGLWGVIETYSGGYAFRIKRSNHQLSMHSFGAALDFNAALNPMKPGIVSNWEIGPRPFSMDLRVVEIARNCNLKWGGDFDDPMHFQYGTGY